MEDTTGSFEDLYRAYYPQVVARAFRLLGDRELADDIAQETMLAAYRYLPEPFSSRSPGPWLCRVARNKAIDLLRKRRGGQEVALAEGIEIAGQGMTGDPQEWYTGDASLVRAALARMPATLRTALILYESEPGSYRELAHRLQTTESAFKARLHRARACFRHSYQEVQQRR